LRVAHLTTVASSLRYLLAAQLVGALEAGHEVIGISAPGEDVGYLAELGVRHIPLPGSTRSFSIRSDLQAAAALGRIVREERVDLLHTHNPKPGLYGRIVGRLVGVPIVVNTVHGLYATDADPWTKQAVVYGLEAVASRFSHAELVQNEEDVDTMRRLRLAPRRRLQHLGNGVDLERFAAGDVVARQSLRADLGAGDATVVVGVVARLVAEKGYGELFEAVPRLPAGCLVVCIGPDDPERPDALPRAVVEKARAAGVRFLGFQAEPERWYHAMDVFVLPSYREGIPRAAMEAAASGLPIVATDVRGCRQVVRHGDNGLLVPARDANALAQALTELAADPKRRHAMGVRSRKLAEDRFDERRVVGTVLATYERLEGERAGQVARNQARRAAS
jgi:glycosyltransferase involved in cell wall biosynthesis